MEGFIVERLMVKGIALSSFLKDPEEYWFHSNGATFSLTVAGCAILATSLFGDLIGRLFIQLPF